MKSVAQEAWNFTRKYLNDRKEDLNISFYEISKRSGLREDMAKKYLVEETAPSVIAYFQLLHALEINPFLVPKEEDNVDKNWMHLN